MSNGILLLRLALAFLLIFGHATQKLAGWPSGPGLDAAGDLFERWGYRPGRVMAALAGGCELVGGVLLAAGLFTPLASALVTGTMLVAAAAAARNGLWNINGGSELALFYAAVSASLAFTGPGRYSLDHLLDVDAAGTGWGIAAAAAALATSAVVLLRRRWQLAARPAASAP